MKSLDTFQRNQGTVNDSPPPQTKHSYLLFGKTGAGKSTILNTLQNATEV